MNLIRLKYYLRLILGQHPLVKRDIKAAVERHGNEYGGWNILQKSLSPEAIVYSIGIGTDISFDQSVMNQYHCKIFAFDPTPQVIQWLQQQPEMPLFHFESIGLGAEDKMVQFFMPENPEHISHSAKPGNSQPLSIELPVRRLKTLMDSMSHSKIDLLKMDIEGFEYEVIQDIILNKLKIRQLLVEFHHGMYGFSVRESMNAIEKLRNAGYKLFNISDSGREYAFINYI